MRRQKSTGPFSRTKRKAFAGVAPSGLEVDQLTSQTEKVTWSPSGSETQREVCYGPAGFNPATAGQSQTVSGTPEAILENLASETSYDVYVRALCGSDHSEWTGFVQFTTGEDMGVKEPKKSSSITLYPTPPRAFCISRLKSL